MGRSARLGLFLLMGLIVALARLVEIEIGKARPEEPPPLAIAKPAGEDHPKKAKKAERRPEHKRLGTPPRVAQPPRADAPAAAPAAVPAPAATFTASGEPVGLEWPKGPVYVVKKGETLADIAKKTLGSSHRWEKLLLANAARVPNPRAVKPGMKLVVPALRAEGGQAKLPH